MTALKEALELMARALLSDPPDGPQKNVVGDDVIYRLDGQTMYLALNAVRDALAEHRRMPCATRDETLEEAATIAEEYDSTGWDASKVKNAIAFCIRALKQKTAAPPRPDFTPTPDPRNTSKQ